jgi:lantibiotic modifying enzyme
VAKLGSMLLRTLVLELNVSRVSGALRGSTPEQRFASFGEAMANQARRRALFSAYPVLGRQLVTAAGHWLRAGTLFARHLAEDWSSISAAFRPGCPLGQVCEVTADLGDRHRRGRSVLRVRWSGGLELMYKPRAMSMDLHFQHLLGWVNDHGASHPFRTVTCLSRPDHGWMEFVAARPCRMRRPGVASTGARAACSHCSVAG